MQLIKWEPLSYTDRLFEDFPIAFFPKLNWEMAVDLYEDQGNLVAKMNLPGIDPNKIDISVEDDILRVSGSREEREEEKDKHYYSKEITRGTFERSIRIPKTIDKAKIDASYKDGNLEIIMPIVEKKSEKFVKVKVKQ
jgi:HSP20 family protein